LGTIDPLEQEGATSTRTKAQLRNRFEGRNRPPEHIETVALLHTIEGRRIVPLRVNTQESRRWVNLNPLKAFRPKRIADALEIVGSLRKVLPG
jgi:hypothetical protein